MSESPIQNKLKEIENLLVQQTRTRIQQNHAGTIKCKQCSEWEIIHVVRVYYSQPEVNKKDKIQKHIFHNYLVKCTACGFESQIKDVKQDVEEIWLEPGKQNFPSEVK